MNRPLAALRAAAEGLARAAAIFPLITGTLLLLARASDHRAPRADPARLGLAPAPGDNSDAAGKACLKASVLLSRRARRIGDHGDEQTLLAMSHVLDALHRGGIDSSGPVPGAILSTLTRLVDHLERREREPGRPVNPPSPGSPHRPPAERGGRGRSATS